MKLVMTVGMALAAAALAAGTAFASSVLGLTIEDQARLSKHVAIGEVVSLHGVDHPVNGLETEVTFRVIGALKGGTQPGRSLIFHTRSGELDGETSTAIGEAALNPGRKFLVFLEEIDGQLYNVGLSYGVFNVVEDASGRVTFVRAIQDGLEVVADSGTGNGPFSVEEIRAHVSWAARHPRFDNPMVEQAFGQGR